MSKESLREPMWGFVGALIALPFGLALGGLAAKSETFVMLMGSNWTVFKTVAGITLMIGFAAGYSAGQLRAKTEKPAVSAHPESNF